MKAKIFAIAAFAAVLSSGAAFAGGTPNDAAGAKGHDAPSSAAPTRAVEAGLPDARVVTGRSAYMHRHRMMRHRLRHMMHHHM
jgi:hypothetical protein